MVLATRDMDSVVYGDLGPDILPIIRPQLFARNVTTRRFLDRGRYFRRRTLVYIRDQTQIAV